MANKRPKKKFKSPAGVARFPRLNNPDRQYNKNGVYTVQLRIPDYEALPFIESITEFMDASMGEVVAKKNQRGGKPKKKADFPWHPSFDVIRNDDPEKENEEVPVPGHHDIRFKLNATFKTRDGDVVHQRPDLVDIRGKAVDPKETLVRGGSTCVVGGFALPFWSDGIGFGVTLRIGAVQVREFASGGGAEAYGFDYEEGDDLSEDDGDDLEAGSGKDDDFDE